MYTYRNFTMEDIDFVLERDFIYGLQIQYDCDSEKENVITLINENNEIGAVASLQYHDSWYDSNPKTTHKLVLSMCTINDNVEKPVIIKEEYEQLLDCLMSGINDIFARLSKDKENVSMITFDYMENIEGIQDLLKRGFCFEQVIPVLAYDLTSDIEHKTIPSNITIKELDMELAPQYIDATGEANNGTKDSISLFYFRSGDESFCNYAAFDGDRIVGGITLWNIGDEGSATENIFVVPDYRRQNIANELIATGLEVLKARGRKEATLSMLGNNSNAMKLYEKIGYRLKTYMTMLKK